MSSSETIPLTGVSVNFNNMVHINMQNGQLRMPAMIPSPKYFLSFTSSTENPSGTEYAAIGPTAKPVNMAIIHVSVLVANASYSW